MNIELELLSAGISEIVKRHINDIVIDIDVENEVHSLAIDMLKKIQSVLQDTELDDFYAIEEIVRIFESYGIDCGVRHDFG